MKIYGTLTSERATKGQGGQKFLDLEIRNAKEETVFAFHIEPTANGDSFVFGSIGGTDGILSALSMK